jgi:ribonuclease D
MLKEVEALTKAELPAHARTLSRPVAQGRSRRPVRVLLKSVAEQHGVAARIIATSDEIDALVLDDDADVPALKGWRRKLFGDKALDIKHGRIGLVATRKGVVEFSVQEAVAAD